MFPPASPQLAHWTERLCAGPVPVLAATRQALAAWRARPEQVDANALADVALRDPLMTLRLLLEVSGRLGPRLSRPVETVTAGLVLLGIEPFFAAFAELETVQERLATRLDAAAAGQALEAVTELVARAHRAARLAAAFAVHRQDENAEALHQAALLAQASTLVLWCQAPAQAAAIARLQAQGSTEEAAQEAVLGVPLDAVTQALTHRWGLAETLRELISPGQSPRPGPRCVALARRIAGHGQGDWDHPALAQDFAALGRVLNLPAGAARELVMDVEAQA